MRRLVGLLHRMVYSLALGLLVWNLYVLPLGLNVRVVGPLLAVANAPVSAVGLLLPCDERGIDAPFGECHHEGGQGAAQFFSSHLRLAIPVYTLVSYLPLLGALLSARVLRRGGRAVRSEGPG